MYRQYSTQVYRHYSTRGIASTPVCRQYSSRIIQVTEILEDNSIIVLRTNKTTDTQEEDEMEDNKDKKKKQNKNKKNKGTLNVDRITELTENGLILDKVHALYTLHIHMEILSLNSNKYMYIKYTYLKINKIFLVSVSYKN